MRPTLNGDLMWCQLFSEPDAGSDAAGVRTRATRVDGGWLVTGQKVWTSGAQHCHRGLATVRTNPDAPKHAGITTVVIDMHAEGVEVRPLREATGASMFNEVFFDDVFVPDDDVVGAGRRRLGGRPLDARQRARQHRRRRRRRGGLSLDVVDLLRRHGGDDHVATRQSASTSPRARRCARSTCAGRAGGRGR